VLAVHPYLNIALAKSGKMGFLMTTRFERSAGRVASCRLGANIGSAKR
jgi:hypothetical protein